MKTIANKNVKDALNYIISRHPFYASLILQQNIIEDNSAPTFYVDGTNLAYNDEFASSITFEENVGVLVHEVLHLVLMHHTRMNKRDSRLWNEACDYCINLQIIRAGFKLPKGALLDYKYDNMSAEDVYRLLEQKQKKEDKNKQNDNKQGDNQKGQSNSDSEDKEGDKPNPCGEVRPSKDKKAEEKVKIQTKQAIAVSKMQGQMPSNSILKALEIEQNAKYNWRALINQFMSEVCAKDYSFEHADQRFLQNGIILPDLHNKTVGNIVFAIDTSGSISLDEVSELVNEVRACLDIMTEDKDSVSLTVIYCDAKVQGIDTFESGADIKPNPKGGGGTAYGPVFQYIEDNDIKPDALFYLTDGYCTSFGNIIPDYPVLWCVTTDTEIFKEPFGERVRMNIY